MCHTCNPNRAGELNGCTIHGAIGDDGRRPLDVNSQVCVNIGEAGETTYGCVSCDHPNVGARGNELCEEFYPSRPYCFGSAGCVPCIPTVGDVANANGRAGQDQQGCAAGARAYCNLVEDNGVHEHPVQANNLATDIVEGTYTLACGGCKLTTDCLPSGGLEQPCNDANNPETPGGSCGSCTPIGHSGCDEFLPICEGGTCRNCVEADNDANTGENDECLERQLGVGESTPYCVEGTCKECNPLIDPANPHKHCDDGEVCCGFKCVPTGFSVVNQNGQERINSVTVDGVVLANYNRCLDCNVGCDVELDDQNVITGKAADSCQDPEADNGQGQAGECRCGAGPACTGARRFCNAQNCVECVSDAHCAANNDDRGQCVNLACLQCDTNDNGGDGINPTCSGIDANAPYCVAGTCAACDSGLAVGANGCGVLEQPVCDSNTLTCRACSTNNECPANVQCLPNGRCDACVDENDCRTDNFSNPEGNVCSNGNCTNCGGQDSLCFGDAGNNIFGNRCVGDECVKCTAHADCDSHPLGNICNLATGMCGPCADDAACQAVTHPSGLKCLIGAGNTPNQCGACIADENTPNGNPLWPCFGCAWPHRHGSARIYPETLAALPPPSPPATAAPFRNPRFKTCAAAIWRIYWRSQDCTWGCSARSSLARRG